MMTAGLVFGIGVLGLLIGIGIGLLIAFNLKYEAYRHCTHAQHAASDGEEVARPSR